MDETSHVPVMVDQVLGFLGGRGVVMDLTLGLGGHAQALLDGGVGVVVGVDRDPAAIARASERLAGYGDRFRAIRARFSHADPGRPVDGVLLDLGVSSLQLDDPGRGFGYRVEGPLDMRMGGPDEEGTRSALELVNELDESELADLLFTFGDERRARRVASAIVRARSRGPIETTDELARVVAGALGKRPGGPHPARRTFQALRIAVNRELEELAASLPQAVGFLAPGGRIVAIAYHSGEDRIVKHAFRDDARLRVLTKKPLRPDASEVAANPRARAAKLRAAEREAA
jgi:16S rRNA (cytosine1402-N4)-methyltransferase